jgi:hypothetical protein
VLPDVGHACTVHGARTYVPGGFLKARSHASIRERDLHLHACICVVVVPDPRAACLLGCKRARAGEQMAGLCVCRPGYAHMHRISGPGGAGRPCQARSASACKCSKDDEAGSAMCRALAATGCCIGHVAPACRRGPSLPGCWLSACPCRAAARDRPPASPSVSPTQRTMAFLTRFTPSIGRRLDRRIQGRIRPGPQESLWLPSVWIRIHHASPLPACCQLVLFVRFSCCLLRART